MYYSRWCCAPFGTLLSIVAVGAREAGLVPLHSQLPGRPRQAPMPPPSVGPLKFDRGLCYKPMLGLPCAGGRVLPIFNPPCLEISPVFNERACMRSRPERRCCAGSSHGRCSQPVTPYS